MSEKKVTRHKPARKPARTVTSKRKAIPRPGYTPGDFLGIAEVAYEFRQSTKSIGRRIRAGQFCPYLKVGNRLLWRRARLIEWFASRESPTGIPVQPRTRRTT